MLRTSQHASLLFFNLYLKKCTRHGTRSTSVRVRNKILRICVRGLMRPQSAHRCCCCCCRCIDRNAAFSRSVSGSVSVWIRVCMLISHLISPAGPNVNLHDWAPRSIKMWGSHINFVILRSPAVVRIGDRTGCQWPWRSSKIDDFYLVCHFLLVINSNIGYISHRFEIRPFIAWNFPVKTAAKPLQMKTWLLLTAYRKSPAPYRMVPSPTPTTYRLAAIHLWQTTRMDGQTYRQTPLLWDFCLAEHAEHA